MFKFLDHRKQAKMQWLQNPDQSNIDNRQKLRVVDISGTKRTNIGERKLLTLKVTLINADISGLYLFQTSGFWDS
jgi:hypothetical protein